VNNVQRLLWWRVLRLVTVLVVAGAVGWTIWQGWRELQNSQVQWEQLRWSWLLVALLCSFAGTVPGWLFWHFTLQQFGIPIRLKHSFRAFYLSQLGKYVPGKVMVLAIRTSIASSVSQRESTATAEDSPHRLAPWLIVSATSVAETLMYVAIGSSLGVWFGASLLSDSPVVLGFAFATATGILVTMLPPIFRQWMIRLPLLKSIDDRRWLANRWSWRLFGGGSLSFALAWLLLACGLLATTAVLPAQDARWQDLPRLLTGVTLSTVIGFFSFLPGGLGVREVVLFPILSPRFSAVLLLVALHRLVTVAAECLAALAAITCVHQPPSQR
jgi:uncharacterized membrane protein YbhN (UPF0104 family)